MLRPSPLTVTAACPVRADMPIGAVVAFLGKTLADTKSVLDAAYGVGRKMPAATEVPWTLRVVAGPDGLPTGEAIQFAIRLDLPDNGAAFRVEVTRRQQVAEMLARVAQHPTGPA